MASRRRQHLIACGTWHNPTFHLVTHAATTPSKYGFLDFMHFIYVRIVTKTADFQPHNRPCIGTKLLWDFTNEVIIYSVW